MSQSRKMEPLYLMVGMLLYWMKSPIETLLLMMSDSLSPKPNSEQQKCSLPQILSPLVAQIVRLLSSLVTENPVDTLSTKFVLDLLPL
nr:MAG TPA: hypothetical protein [Caudoviricetes sp.]